MHLSARGYVTVSLFSFRIGGNDCSGTVQRAADVFKCEESRVSSRWSHVAVHVSFVATHSNLQMLHNRLCAFTPAMTAGISHSNALQGQAPRSCVSGNKYEAHTEANFGDMCRGAVPYQIPVPAGSSWCAHAGSIHQDVPGCGRVCSDASGDRGVLKNEDWPNAPCDACPGAKWASCGIPRTSKFRWIKGQAAQCYPPVCPPEALLNPSESVARARLARR